MHQNPLRAVELGDTSLRHLRLILFLLCITFEFCLLLGAPTYARADELNMDTLNTRAVQMLRASGKTVAQIAASACTGAAITSDGTLWMWGANGCGQLGNGRTQLSCVPVKVMGDVKQVSLSISRSAAVKTDGTLWTWGDNHLGSLGDGTTVERHTPVQIMTGVNMVSCGPGAGVAAVKSDGTLWTWGYNASGILGYGYSEDEFEAEPHPTPRKIMDSVKLVRMGFWGAAAIKTDGSLWMWGSNWYGELGDGTSENERLSPVQVMTDVADVALGTRHTAAIKNDKSLWIWGWNNEGQLGNGTTQNRSRPYKLMDGVNEVSLGASHSTAVKSDGSLWLWGANKQGQLGTGNRSGSNVPLKLMDGVREVAATGFTFQADLETDHTLALKEDGTIWAWGSNSQYRSSPSLYEGVGQLGDGTTTDRLSPIQITIAEESSSNPSGGSTTIYRLLNNSTGEHLYTAQKNEHDYLVRTGAWKSEGEAWQAPTSGKPVYRLYNPSIDDHLYTTDENEKNVLMRRGWQIDNNGNPFFYSGGSTPIYRLYNEGNGRHLITKDTYEYRVLHKNGWKQEGLKLWAV